MLLGDLIQSLQNLYLKVASRLWQRRMQNPAGGVNDPVEITDYLRDHIEQSAAEARTANNGGAGNDTNGTLTPGMERSKKKPKLESPTGIFDALARYFRGRRKGETHVEPHLAEKMRHKTMYHLNKAVLQARQGNTAGAKMHAELAENAMETAGDYMADDDYQVFKADVEGRIRQLKT